MCVCVFFGTLCVFQVVLDGRGGRRSYRSALVGKSQQRCAQVSCSDAARWTERENNRLTTSRVVWEKFIANDDWNCYMYFFFIFLSPRFFSSLHFSIVFFLSAVCPVDVYCRLTSRPYCGIHTLAIRVRDDSLCGDLLYWSSSSLDAFYLRSRFFFLLLLLVIAAYNETHRKRKKKDGQLCISSGFLSVVRALLLFRFRRKQS